MANTILTPNIIAKEALAILRNNAVMANLVHRDYSSEFAKVGDTITIRKPATFTANEFNQSTGITVQDATEASATVKMDKLLDVSFAVTSKEMALSIEDFSKQLLEPAMMAFADKIDKYLIALEAGITNRVPHAADDIAVKDIVAARKFLSDGKAPMTDRSLVLGTQAEADLLNNAQFTSAEKVGDEGTTLREASLGRKFGFNLYVDQNVGSVEVEDGADYKPTLAFHKNAFALVTRPLEVPMGSAKASIENFDGFALRVVYDYDINTKKDTISIDMLCGVATLNRDLAAVIADTRA